MFEKTGDVPVEKVEKLCPSCRSRLIAADVLQCDVCKAEAMKLKPTDDNKGGESNALQNS